MGVEEAEEAEEEAGNGVHACTMLVTFCSMMTKSFLKMLPSLDRGMERDVVHGGNISLGEGGYCKTSPSPCSKDGRESARRLQHEAGATCS